MRNGIEKGSIVDMMPVNTQIRQVPQGFWCALIAKKIKTRSFFYKFSGL